MQASLKRRRGAEGLTLIEMAIVLGVVGLVFGAIWVVSGAVWKNHQSQRLSQQIVTVAQNIRDYYMNSGRINVGYDANTGTVVPCATNDALTGRLNDEQRRLIPLEMRNDPTADGSDAVSHALGGAFSVWCLSSGGGFQIRALGMDKAGCMKLLLDFPVLSPEMGVTRVRATPSGRDSGTLNLTALENPGVDFPMNPARADAWCSGNDRNNEVRFDFKLRN